MITFDVTVPELCIVVFRVLLDDNSEKSESLAYSSVPLPYLRTGLRNVTLLDESGNRNGDYLFANMLIRVAFESKGADDKEIQRGGDT